MDCHYKVCRQALSVHGSSAQSQGIYQYYTLLYKECISKQKYCKLLSWQGHYISKNEKKFFKSSEVWEKKFPILKDDIIVSIVVNVVNDVTVSFISSC